MIQKRKRKQRCFFSCDFSIFPVVVDKITKKNEKLEFLCCAYYAQNREKLLVFRSYFH